jgi:DNA (cytosine-5)-methyltransferase 1
VAVRQLRAVSLFSNCGAGDLGFSRAGFNFSVMAELEPRRLEVAKLNHPDATLIAGDLRETWKAVCREYRHKHGGTDLDLLAACPPCQGMSSARSGRGAGTDPDAGLRDSRNLLVMPIIDVALSLKPKLVVIENVPAFLTRLVRNPRTGEPVSAALLLVQALADTYEPFAVSMDLANYGVPQTRRRCFITFVRRDLRAFRKLVSAGVSPFPRPTHGTGGRPHVSVWTALESMSLPALDARSEARAKSSRSAMHQVPLLSRRLYQLVAAIPPMSGSSAWETRKCTRCRRVTKSSERAVCERCQLPLRRPVVKVNGRWRLVHGFRSSSYRRMSPQKPSATITTASGHVGSDTTIHPWENRVLSPLECALLQTFPRSFAWGSTLQQYGAGFVREVIGEAVPPRFTERHGRILVKLLRGNIDRSYLPSSDWDCYRAEAKLLGLARSA